MRELPWQLGESTSGASAGQLSHRRCCQGTILVQAQAAGHSSCLKTLLGGECRRTGRKHMGAAWREAASWGQAMEVGWCAWDSLDPGTAFVANNGRRQHPGRIGVQGALEDSLNTTRLNNAAGIHHGDGVSASL